MDDNKKELSQRKTDHIALAFESQMGQADPRFIYEPLFAHGWNEPLPVSTFGTQTLHAPIWISSMTGGAENAGKINKLLATACAKYGLGMGLGSCRPLLENTDFASDFDLRKQIGNQPLYANLGIAQLEQIATSGTWSKVKEMLKMLQADGLIIHVNPLQEWMQPGGDYFASAPLQTIEQTIDALKCNIIVKEVGQGMGPRSIHALLQLPILALDFGAFGGTNFSKLELLRQKGELAHGMEIVPTIGHNAEQMTAWVNLAMLELGNKVLCKNIIVSGGIANFMDGYYYTQKLTLPAIYGQASKFLHFATQGENALNNFIEEQIRGLQMANKTLQVF